MKNSVLNFPGSTPVPVLRSDVAAGSARNVHLGPVAVLAVRALPNELAVVVLDLDLAVVQDLG